MLATPLSLVMIRYELLSSKIERLFFVHFYDKNTIYVFV